MVSIRTHIIQLKIYTFNNLGPSQLETLFLKKDSGPWMSLMECDIVINNFSTGNICHAILVLTEY
jgi:hypothetical protein